MIKMLMLKMFFSNMYLSSFYQDKLKDHKVYWTNNIWARIVMPKLDKYNYSSKVLFAIYTDIKCMLLKSNTYQPCNTCFYTNSY